MENTNNFTDAELTQIFEFVKKYDGFNDSIKDLELKIKSLLDEQEGILKSLGDVRKEEEAFFTTASERSGLHPSQLKKIAQSLVMNLTNE